MTYYMVMVEILVPVPDLLARGRVLPPMAFDVPFLLVEFDTGRVAVANLDRKLLPARVWVAMMGGERRRLR